MYGFWDWQDYALSDGDRLRKLPADMDRPSLALGALGLPGFGAYIALTALPKGPNRTPVLLNQIIFKRLQLRGLVVFDHMKAHFEPFQREMSDWIASGKVLPLEELIEDLEQAPKALQGMFEGRNRGKLVVRVGA